MNQPMSRLNEAYLRVIIINNQLNNCFPQHNRQWATNNDKIIIDPVFPRAFIKKSMFFVMV